MGELSLAARLRLKNREFNAGVTLSTNKVGELNNEVTQTGAAGKRGAVGLDKTARSAKKLERQSGSTAQSLLQVKNVITGIALGLAGQSFSSTIIEYDKFGAQLETVFKGSEQFANSAFTAIESFATKTPFTLDQSLNAFIQLRNLGIAPTQELMLSMANTAAAQGKSLSQFTEAIADASTNEFERLKEFGITASKQGDDVAFTFQGVTTKVKASSNEIVAYLQGIGESNFAGAAARQMERLPGLISNLQDNVESLWRTFADQGATSVAAQSIRFLSDGVSDLDQLVSSGALSEGFEAYFSGWAEPIDTATTELSLFVGFLAEALSGEELKGSENGFIELIKFIGESVADLPENLRAYFTIVIGELDKLQLSAREQFELILFSAEETWLSVGQAGTAAIDTLQLAVAIGVDFILERYASMVGGIADALLSLPDAVIPDGWIAGIQSAEDSIRGFASAEADARAEIAANQAAYEAELAALAERKAATTDYYDVRRDAANQAIDMALLEREQALAAKDAAVELAAASFAAGEAAEVTAEEHNKLAYAYFEAGDAATESGEAATKAADKAIKAAEKKLAAVEKSTETERDKVLRWYEESVVALEEAERLKLDATKSYAQLRADVDDQYYEKLTRVAENEARDNKKALEDRYKDYQVFGVSLGGLYGDFGDLWDDLNDRNSTSSLDSFDTILDAAKKLFAQIALQFAAKGLDKLFGLSGDGGFSFAGALGALGVGGQGGFDLGSIGSNRADTGGINPLGLSNTGGNQTADYLANAFGIDADQVQGALNGLGGLYNFYRGVEQGDTGGYIQAASGGVEAYNALQSFTGGNQLSNNFTSGLGLLGNGFGIVDGIKQGGLEGYTSAAVNGWQFYQNLQSLGLLGSGAGVGVNAAGIAALNAQPVLTAVDVGASAVNATGTTATQTATTGGGTLGTVGQVAGVAVGAYNIYDGIDRGNSAGYTQAAGGAATIAGSLGFLGPYGAAIGALVSILAAGRGSRPYEQIFQEDYSGDLLGSQGADFARGEDGGLGFAGGNQAVFGNNQGFDRAGLSTQHLVDGGANGNGGFIFGAQESLEGLKKALEAAGFDEALDISGGALRVLDKDKTVDDILAVWQAYDENLEESVTNTASLKTALENALFRDGGNLLYEDLSLSFNENAAQSRESILAIRSAYLALRESSVPAIEALTQAFGEHYDVSAEYTQAFFDETGNSMQAWGEQFESVTQEQLSDLLDFGADGTTAFEQITKAGEFGAQQLGLEYSGVLSGLTGEFSEFSAEALAKLAALQNGANDLTFFDVGNNGVAPGFAQGDPATGTGARNTSGLQSFEVGTPRLQNDGLVYAHKDEMIIDPQTSRALRQYGIEIKGAAGGGGDSAVAAETYRAINQLVQRLDLILPHLTQTEALGVAQQRGAA